MSDLKRDVDDMVKEIGDLAEASCRRLRAFAESLAGELVASTTARVTLPPHAAALLEYATVALVHDFYHDHAQGHANGRPCDGDCGHIRVQLQTERSGVLCEPDRTSGGNCRDLHCVGHNGQSRTFLPEGHFRAIVVFLPIPGPDAAKAAR